MIILYFSHTLDTPNAASSGINLIQDITIFKKEEEKRAMLTIISMPCMSKGRHEVTTSQPTWQHDQRQDNGRKSRKQHTRFALDHQRNKGS